MMIGQLQSVTSADTLQDQPVGKTMLALNNAHAQELSWLEPERLEHLVNQAFLVRRIGNLDAFLLAFDQSARYDSPNFLWFRARYPRLSMWTASWSHRQRADAAMRAGFMTICLNMHFRPDTSAWSARSTRSLRIRRRMRSMQR
jgi:predicted GNAT superfamily acetyltransferase